MDFFETVEKRRSIRAFQSRAVEESKVRAILDAANSAPSAGNLQAYEIYLVTKAEQRIALARAAGRQDFIAQAPLILVFFANPSRSAVRYGQRGVRLYCLQDATIATTFAHLAATALGLGSVWIGAFSDEAVSRVVGAPGDLIPVAILPIGYPAERPGRTSRRTIADLVHEI
ncbi:MAG: nitroreductase family protein [Anaerolineae bacterium]